jgi:hypothetical protein
MSASSRSAATIPAVATVAAAAAHCCWRLVLPEPVAAEPDQSPEEIALTSMMAAEEAERKCADTPGCKLLRFLHSRGLNHVFPVFKRAGLGEYEDVTSVLDLPREAADARFAEIGLSVADVAALRLVLDDVRSASSSMGGSTASASARSSVEVTEIGEAVSLADVRQHVNFLQWNRLQADEINSWVINDPGAEIEQGRFIAEGTSGNVYQGRWQGMNVAIKVYKSPVKASHSSMFKTAADDLDAQRRATAEAMNEMQLMRRMQHQSILRLYGACITPPTLIIVSELCVGSLSSLLYGKISAAAAAAAGGGGAGGGWSERLTPRWESAFVKGIATGMAFLHLHNVGHRDLKSANVLFDRGLMPKICDFAFSKHSSDISQQTRLARSRSVNAGATEAERLRQSQSQSQPLLQRAASQSGGGPTEHEHENEKPSDWTTGQVGTTQWMAPEVLGDGANAFTAKSDVWSFGVIVWEILNRKRPYGKTPPQVQYSIVPAILSSLFLATG